MIGQNLVIKLRKDGYTPPHITVADSDWYANESRSPRFTDHIAAPCVTVEDGDNIGLLDFRFVVGLNVCVEGVRSLQRTKDLFAAVLHAKPANAWMWHHERWAAHGAMVINGKVVEL